MNLCSGNAAHSSNICHNTCHNTGNRDTGNCICNNSCHNTMDRNTMYPSTSNHGSTDQEPATESDRDGGIWLSDVSHRSPQWRRYSLHCTNSCPKTAVIRFPSCKIRCRECTRCWSIPVPRTVMSYRMTYSGGCSCQCQTHRPEQERVSLKNWL